MSKAIRGQLRPSVVELFAGAGFLGRAFREEGFHLEAAYEIDPVAARTCSANASKLVLATDLAKERPRGKCEILLAGPPCQGFSSIGSRSAEDPRNDLALVIPGWAAKTDATVVVVENVPRFLVSSQRAALERRMRRKGFTMTSWTLNARDYGVAQNRTRSFAIFSRRGVPAIPKEEEQTSTGDAFYGLRSFPDENAQHYTRPQSPETMRKIKLIPGGGDIRDLARLAPHLVPKSWYKTGGKVVDIWGRLCWEGVSNTVRTGFLHPSRGRFLHPVEHRPISFREAARLQSVPDDYFFFGLPEQIARQIGNGVPIRLGRAVARSIRELF